MTWNVVMCFIVAVLSSNWTLRLTGKPQFPPDVLHRKLKVRLEIVILIQLRLQLELNNLITAQHSAIITRQLFYEEAFKHRQQCQRTLTSHRWQTRSHDFISTGGQDTKGVDGMWGRGDPFPEHLAYFSWKYYILVHFDMRWKKV